jgi:hypothetical protein
MLAFPVDVFREIQSYLILEDENGVADDVGYLNLMSSCSAFSHTKYETIHVKLFHVQGIKRLSERVRNSFLQVSLVLTDPTDDVDQSEDEMEGDEPADDSSLWDGFADEVESDEDEGSLHSGFAILSSVSADENGNDYVEETDSDDDEGGLSGMDEKTFLQDYDGSLSTELRSLRLSSFSFSFPIAKWVKSIYRLSLHCCEGVVSLDGLNYIHELELSCIGDLVDISHLRNAKHLKKVHIVMCPKISDLSALHGVQIVSIRFCPSVSDLSCLGGHTSIVIEKCSFNCESVHFTANATDVKLVCEAFKSDLSILAEVKGSLFLGGLRDCPYSTLSLDSFRGTSLNLRRFKFVRRQFLGGCPNLQSLRFHDCRNVGFCFPREQRKPLKSVCYEDCDDFTSADSFPDVRDLRIEGCRKVVSLDGLNKNGVKSFKIRSLRKFRGFNLLSGILDVEIVDMNIYDEDLIHLKDSRSVSIRRCNEITSLRYLDRVPFLVVRSCQRLCNLDDLIHNRRVTISDCPIIYENYITGKYEHLEKTLDYFVVMKK